SSSAIGNNMIKQLYKCSLDIVQLTRKQFLRAGATRVIKMCHGTRPVCPGPSTPRERSPNLFDPLESIDRMQFP
ncbi:unnamed protein product, partial [Heterotrigona itama]